ncbi:MAG: OadG family protein [Anaerolineales bacterium]|nr:OadG family protein [Anaerolineales bacterium]
MTFTNIGTHNFTQPGLDALQFSLMGMGLVFGGLVIIAIYITLLPRLLKLGHAKPQQDKTSKDTTKGEEEEILLAIATALHLHNNFPDGDERITWKSHGDMESPWLVSGRMHSLNSRKLPNPWNH